jgi:hypothetical protein
MSDDAADGGDVVVDVTTEEAELLVGKRFGGGKPYQDLPFSFAFLLFYAMILCIFVYGWMQPPVPYMQDQQEFWILRWLAGLQGRQLVMLGMLTAACMGTSTMWSLVVVALLRSNATAAVWTSLIVAIVVNIVQCVVLFVDQMYLLGGIWVLVTLLSMFYAYLVRSHIPFTVALLTTVGNVMKKVPGILVACAIGVVLQGVFLAFWITAVGVTQRITPIQGFAVLFVMFLSLFWMSQTIKNTIHVICAGSFATWYFEDPLPPSVVLPSTKRALTSSFGSIVFGSFLVAVSLIICSVITLLLSVFFRRLSKRVAQRFMF